jgi:predicted nucleotidyltransferase
MQRKIWIKKSHSYAEAQEFDDAYYLSLSASERLEAVQFLREEYGRLSKGKKHESGKNLRRVLGLLNRNKVRYCIVGAYAVAFYAKPRYTKDIDILIEPSQRNAQHFLNALNDIGFGELSISLEDLTTEGSILQLGYEPLRIDLLTKLEGFQFQEIWRNRVTGDYGSEKVHFIGLDDLIQNKRQAARPTDQIDIDLLEKARKKLT